MNIVDLLFSFNCTNPGAPSYVKPIFDIIKTVLTIIRIVVPIGLIVLTTFDVIKKVIDPNEKEGQKKVMLRAISALIVFLIPTVINIAISIIDAGKPERTKVESSLSACWKGK